MGCLAILALGLFALVATEIVLRRVMPTQFGRPLALRGLFEVEGEGYHLTPSWSGVVSTEDGVLPIRTDGHGLRGVRAAAATAVDKRVLVLGDDRVFGVGLRDQETIPAQLQRILREKMQGVAVVVDNGGVPGYGTGDLARAMRRHRDLKPDAVIAFTYLGDDALDDCRQHTDVVGGILFHGAAARAARRSPAMRAMLRFRIAYVGNAMLRRLAPTLAFDPDVLPPSRAEELASARFPTGTEGRRSCIFLDRRVSDPMVEEVMGRFRASFAALLAAAPPVPTLLVLLPSPDHLSTEAWRSVLRAARQDPDSYEFGVTQERLVGLADELKLPCLDLTARLRGAPRRESLWNGTLLTEAGCIQVAGWLAREALTMLEH